MKLTKAEQELILKNRAKQEEEKPKKTGVLKHDLYFFEEREPYLSVDVAEFLGDGWFLTEKDINAIVEKCRYVLFSGIKAPKGTICECFIDNKRELWFDTAGIGIEELDADWAKENLENIIEL